MTIKELEDAIKASGAKNDSQVKVLGAPTARVYDGITVTLSTDEEGVEVVWLEADTYRPDPEVTPL